MKAFIKALPMAIFPTIITISAALVIHFLLFGNEYFEAFFGFAVDEFNLLKYGIATILVWIIFALIFRSDYEEV